MPALPQGWVVKQLGDLLPDNAIQEITDLFNAGKLTLAELKRICARHKAELAAKDVDDTFLAYMLAHTFGLA